MTVRFVTLSLGCLLVGYSGLGACRVAPQASYRYAVEAAELEGWEMPSNRLLCSSLEGVEVQVDLSGDKAPILVAVVNGSDERVEVRMGVQATSMRGPVGEVLQRPLRAADGVQSPAARDYRPFGRMEPIEVARDYRAWFHLDRLVRGDLTFGQYFVLDLEVRLADGRLERRQVPLVVRYAEGPGSRMR